MKNSIIKFLVIFLICAGSAYSQSGWVPQSGGTTNNLFSVYFVNNQTGWISGDSGLILSTTNGGINWIRQTSGTTYPLLNIMFANANTGWAAGGYDDNNPLCYNYNVVSKTTNGGINWITQTGGGPVYFYNDLAVVNDQTAFVCNAGVCCPPFCIQSAGGVYGTYNFGSNWNGSLGDAYFSLFFLNESVGWAAGQSSSDVLAPIDYIYKTTNTGMNWERILYDTAYNYNPYRNVMFVNENTGFAWKGTLLKSTNSGVSWNNTDSISTSGITNLYFINADTGWCTGWNGKIIRTDNGGNNWNTQLSNSTNVLSSIHFNDAYYGWAVGRNGTILKTITGGLTSVNQYQTSAPDKFELSQNYPNPFNPSTIINFSLSQDAGSKLQDVKLIIYDVTGKIITTLVNESKAPGNYSVEWQSGDFPSGIYFYKLETNSFTQTKRMVLLK